MNRKLFLYECLMLWRSGAFRAAILILTVLLFFAAMHQRDEWNKQTDQLTNAVNAFQEDRTEATTKLQLVEAGEKSYSSMWDDPRGYYTWHQQLAPLPRDPANILAVGQRDLYAPVNKVGVFGPTTIGGRELGNPIPTLFGTFDPAFVLVFLVPLFFIGISHGMVTSERETGTIRLLAANGGGVRNILLLKAMPRFVIGVGSMLLITLAAPATAGWNPLTNAAQTMAMVALLTAYGLFWFLAALMVNLTVRATASAAMSLICLWGLVCIALPAGISGMSKRLFPVPSRIDMISEVREQGREAERQAHKIMARFYHDHPELGDQEQREGANQRFFDYYCKSLSVGLAVETAVQPTHRHFATQQEKQQKLESTLSYLSPAALLAESLAEIAGGSTRQLTAYSQAVANFSVAWRRYFQKKAFAGDLITSQDLATLPQFTFSQPSAKVIKRLGVLALINGLLIGLIFWRSRGRGIDLLI